MTKIIVFSDLHAHKFMDFSEVDEITGNSRLTSILNCLDEIGSYARKNGIKHVLFGGDLFHKRGAVDTVTFNLTYNKIKDMADSGLKLVLLKGNHDAYSNQLETEHSLEAFKSIPNVAVLDSFQPHLLEANEDSPIIFPVPYSKDAAMVKAEIEEHATGTTNEGLEKQAILLGHLGLSGAFVGKSSYAMSDSFVVEDLFPHAFRFVALGHFHKPQDLGGYDHVFYTGAPIQHNFNDEGEDRGFMVLDMETGTKELIPIASPKFITVTDWKDVDEKVIAGNFIRYKVDASEVEALAESLPENSKHRLEIQKSYEEEKRMDIDFSNSFEEIIKAYAKEKNPEAEALGLEIFRDSQTK